MSHNFLSCSPLGRCPDSECGKNGTNGVQVLQPQARSLEPIADALLQPAEDGALMASYSVFVLEPGEQVGKLRRYEILIEMRYCFQFEN